MPKKPLEPDADFERDENYVHLIRQLRDVEEEHVSDSFDAVFAQKRRSVQPTKSLWLLLRSLFSAAVEWTIFPRYRLVIPAAIAAVIVVIVVSAVQVQRQPYWRSVFDQISRQEQAYSFSNPYAGTKDIDVTEVPTVEGNQLIDRVPSSIFSLIDTSKLLQSTMKKSTE